MRWDASGYKGILIDDLYRPTADKWGEVNRIGREAIKYYSEQWFPYPWSHATTVEGPIEGMEYPMLTFTPNSPTREDQQWVIAHEFGHEWFPMLVGSNERRYAWMDEGFNTYQNAFSLERRNPGTDEFPGYLANWRQTVESGNQSPLMTPPDRIDPDALGAVGYRKPGAVLLALRDNVIGRDAMDRAMREYARRWAFKHPTPADFFRTVENVSGEDLSWFWNAFFYGTDVLDIAIDGLSMHQSDGQNIAEIHLRRVTSVPFPVTVRLLLNDKTTQDVRLPVEIWARTDRYTAEVVVRRPVIGARLWPDSHVPDWNSANDVWGDAPPVDRATASTDGGLAPAIAPKSTGQ
jgi:hypothetical protein